MSSSDAQETLTQTRSSAAKFYKAFWEAENINNNAKEDDDDDNDDSDASGESDNDALKSVSGSSSLDADGGSCGPGDDAFCISNMLWLSAAGCVMYFSDFVNAVILDPISGNE